jgi:predicted O-methyltransferase YrrM
MILVSLIYSEQPEVIFESGTAIGWSSSWMAVATDSPIITFDPVARDQVFSVSTGNITRVLGTFDTEIHKWAPKYANNKKMVFIDGDHGRSAVVADTMAVVPYLRPYDILIYHDTDKCGTVQKALHYDIIPAFPSWEVKRFATRRGMIALTVK